jgi:hypothetical protein
MHMPATVLRKWCESERRDIRTSFLKGSDPFRN